MVLEIPARQTARRTHMAKASPFKELMTTEG
jgi:hypothetical protein